MNPFDAVVAIFFILAAGGVVTTLISTVGKVLTARAEARKLPPEQAPSEIADRARTADVLEEVQTRLERLEEERDFYRDLLGSPERPRVIRPAGTEGTTGDGDA